MRFFLYCFLSLFLAGAAVQSVHAQKYADILMDAHTGHVIQGTDPDGSRFPASLTKIMTLYIMFEALKAGKITFNTSYPVSANAVNVEPCRLGLRVGQTITVKHIILGLITKSANDASVVAAEGLGGSISKFAEKMNQTARKLGMNNTHFCNPHGLPNDRQVTTARDMAILSKALIHNFPEYYKLFKTRVFMYGSLAFPNHNSLLGKGGIDGIKTGFFRRAGSNLAASAVRMVNGKPKRLIAVVLGGENRFVRNKRITALLDIGFGTHATKATPQTTEYIERVTPTLDSEAEEGNQDPIGELIHHQETKLNAAPLIYAPVTLPKPIKDKITHKSPKMVWVKGTLDTPPPPLTKPLTFATKSLVNGSSAPSTAKPLKLAKTVQRAIISGKKIKKNH